MRFVLAIVLAAHGIAHLVGFVSSWQLAVLPELPYKTTILGGSFDVGDVGVRVIGLLWLLAAVTFAVAAFAIATETRWAFRLTLFAVVASLFLCAAAWPDSRIGVAVNAGLLLILIVGVRLNLVALAP